jgi:hypothetical protein
MPTPISADTSSSWYPLITKMFNHDVDYSIVGRFILGYKKTT